MKWYTFASPQDIVINRLIDRLDLITHDRVADVTGIRFLLSLEAGLEVGKTFLLLYQSQMCS